MSTPTRIVARALLDLEPPQNEGTVVHRLEPRAPLALGEAAALFRALHRELDGLLRARGAPKGVLVCAAGPRHGLVGSLWLKATEEVRSGTIGRHGAAELRMPEVPELPLRQALVLVRLRDGRPLVRFADLESGTGLTLADGSRSSGIEADGPTVLRIPGFAFFVLPTGDGPQWDARAADPWQDWSTRTARIALAGDRQRLLKLAAASGARRGEGEERPRLVTPVSAPLSGDEPFLRGDGAREAGVLILSGAKERERLALTQGALERGVLLGRYTRCNGATWAGDEVSRVHALVLSVDGVVHIADAGSTNGIYRNKREVKCVPLRPGEPIRLGLGRGVDVDWRPRE